MLFISSKNPEKYMDQNLHKLYFLKPFLTLILKAANQHAIMISERSCDTGDWNNDAKNSALYHRNKV